MVRQYRSKAKAAPVQIPPLSEADLMARWNEVFAKAARVALMLTKYPQVGKDHSWWFDSFKLDAEAEVITVDNAGDQAISRSTFMLSERLYEDMNGGLTMALQFFEEHIQELERQRKIEEHQEKVRQTALAKLTKEEIEVLSLQRFVRFSR